MRWLFATAARLGITHTGEDADHLLAARHRKVPRRGYLRSVLRTLGGVAPPPTGAVIHADSTVPGHGRARPNQGQRSPL